MTDHLSVVLPMNQQQHYSPRIDQQTTNDRRVESERALSDLQILQAKVNL